MNYDRSSLKECNKSKMWKKKNRSYCALIYILYTYPRMVYAHCWCSVPSLFCYTTLNTSDLNIPENMKNCKIVIEQQPIRTHRTSQCVQCAYTMHEMLGLISNCLLSFIASKNVVDSAEHQNWKKLKLNMRGRGITINRQWEKWESIQLE